MSAPITTSDLDEIIQRFENVAAACEALRATNATEALILACNIGRGWAISMKTLAVFGDLFDRLESALTAADVDIQESRRALVEHVATARDVLAALRVAADECEVRLAAEIR